MKKLKLSAIIVCMVMVAALCFSGCEFLSGAQYLTVKEMPKTQFTQDESWTLTEENLNKVGFSFTIQVTKGNESTTYVFGRDAKTGETAISMGEGATQFSIKGFDLSKTGSHLATIKIGSANGSFQYEVIGNGKGTSESDAIKISTVEDFYKMEAWNQETWAVDSSKKDVYYKLTNDIDFGVVDDSILNAFSGHLNGNGYTVSATFTNAGDSTGGDYKGTGLVFIVLDNAELKNIDFNLTGGDNSIYRSSFNKIVMNNVDRYGSCTPGTSNRSLYAATFQGFNRSAAKMMVKNAAGEVTGYKAIRPNAASFMSSVDITMVECDNYATMASTWDTAAVYFAYGFFADAETKVNVTMERCNNYGDVDAVNSSVYLGNGAFASDALDDGSLDSSKIALTDCYNYGKVSGKSASVVLGVNKKDSEIEKYPFITVKAGSKTGNACAEELNKTVDGKVGACSAYTTVPVKYATANTDGKVVLDSKGIATFLNSDVAYFRMSAWFEAYVYTKDEAGEYTNRTVNTKQYIQSKRYDAPASGSLTTQYYFLSATTGEGTIATEVGRMLLEKEGKKYYSFTEYEDRGEYVKLNDVTSNVLFKVFCYDANNNVIGYMEFDSSSTIGK